MITFLELKTNGTMCEVAPSLPLCHWLSGPSSTMSSLVLIKIAFLVIELGDSSFIIFCLGVMRVWVKENRVGLSFGGSWVAEIFELEWFWSCQSWGARRALGKP